MSTTFSVATPSFNSLEKLKRCVGSVRGQRDVEVEHLINDAASSDGTPEWLATQSGLASEVRPDRGMYDAINLAWGRSRGDILSWLNSDEQYLPGTLAKVRSFFDAHPKVDVLFGNYIVVDSEGRPIALRREVPFRRLYVKNSFLNMQSCTLFFRRRLLTSNLLNLESAFRYAADKDLIMRLADAGTAIRHLNTYLALFGIDGTNLTTHARAAEEAESIRVTHGAFGLKPLRQLVVGVRRLERFFRGGYKKESITYLFALDERPNYAEFSADSVGGRYDIFSTPTHVESSQRIVPSDD